jgi:hypothetical protein
MRHSAIPTLLAALVALGCDYDPPPDVVTFACQNNLCVVGEPIVLVFSEPVRPESVAVEVWPGARDAYDLEGRRLPSAAPIVPLCTWHDSPCGADEGVRLVLDEGRKELSISVSPGALGPLYQPLVLELKGTLRDDAGRTLDVTRSFDFQMVPGVAPPPSDTVGGDGGGNDDALTPGDTAAADVPPEFLGVREGPLLFFAMLAVPSPRIDLPQQYFGDVQIDQETGAFSLLLTDADPIANAPLNTTNPAELELDLGIEGFVFLVQGTIRRQDGALVFESRPFTLQLKIGTITFALRETTMRGTISVDAASGLTRWDGTMAVTTLMIQIGAGAPQDYPAQQNNFALLQLRSDEVPAGLPRVCDANPCADLVGPQCDVPSEGWPPADVCPDDDAP